MAYSDMTIIYVLEWYHKGTIIIDHVVVLQISYCKQLLVLLAIAKTGMEAIYLNYFIAYAATTRGDVLQTVFHTGELGMSSCW